METLTSSQLAYLTEVDHRDHEALVAIDMAAGDSVGVGRYVREGGFRACRGGGDGRRTTGRASASAPR